jgi:hypothetical protein
MHLTRRLSFACAAAALLVFLGSSAASGDSPTALYDVDFSSPLHTVGSIPTTGFGAAPRATPTSVTTSTSRVQVVSSYGDLIDQPMAFPSGSRGTAAFSMTGLAAGPMVVLEMNVVVDDDLRLILSAPNANVIHFRPNGDVVATIYDMPTSQTTTVVGSYNPGDGAVHSLVVAMDFATDQFGLMLDGVPVLMSSFGEQAALATFSLLGTFAAVDDIVVGSGAEEEPVVPATVGLRPGSDGPASVNLRSKGVFPVALLSTEDLDASDVDETSLLLSDTDGNGDGVAPARAKFTDVDGDGVDDLLLHFATADLVDAGVLTADTTSLTLTGETLDGAPLSGVGEVVVVGK